MRVLHLPRNLSSLLSHTVRGLRSVGIDAYGLVIENSPIQSHYGLKVIEDVGLRQWSLLWFWKTLISFCYFLKLVIWADVIHWYFGPFRRFLGLDILIIKILRKPGVVEWLGSDIRIPEVEFKDNKYYKEAFHNGYEYMRMESYRNSIKNQKYFIRSGFIPMVAPASGMLQYIEKKICHNFYIIRQRIMLSDYIPCYPESDKKIPLVVHATSAPIAKGTPQVLRTVEYLKKNHTFEFILIKDMPRDKALDLMRKADIFLDQFVFGSHGMAALEAMALGKPVLCYIKSSLINEFPQNCPIINANIDNLSEILGMILKDGKLRNEIGKSSRAYVEEYHDAIKLSHQLVSIYHSAIKRV